jgi:N-carbamoylputrescine amidase
MNRNFMNIGVCQFNSEGTKERNLQKSIDLIKKLAQDGAEVICLQELFLTDYFCFEENPDFFALADDYNNSEVIKALEDVSKQTKTVLIASCYEKRMTGLYHNTIIVFDSGAKVGLYRKHHIPDDPGYYEKYYFAPGDEGYKVFDTSKGRIGTLICWDQWYPEAARATALKGADVIFYPTAIGWDMNDPQIIREEEVAAWKIMHQSHAISNGIPIVAVNRTGEENGLKFWGSSIVVNAMGRIVYEGSVDVEESIVMNLDLTETSYYRHRWPFLRDRRIDTYQTLLKRADNE